ncbi:transcriptional regulator [Bacillus pseudomycoides]|nr:transcriptional regulator [Bacillus pseudomycoides]PHC81470.1 transcriptional regulator [Bacillus pseudomycoides]
MPFSAIFPKSSNVPEKSGVSKSTISRICQGDSFAPTMKNAQKIVQALKRITNKDDIHYDDFWM